MPGTWDMLLVGQWCFFELGFEGRLGSAGKEFACNAEFDPWVGKISWRRDRLPTPVFWPGEFHGLYSLWDRKESDTTEWLSLPLSLRETSRGGMSQTPGGGPGHPFMRVLSVVSDSAAPWTVACQTPLSVGLPSQEYWSGLLFPSPGGLPDPRTDPASPLAPALGSGFFTPEPPAQDCVNHHTDQPGLREEYFRYFPVGSDDKESSCNLGHLGLIPRLGGSLGGGHGNPLQYPCLDRGHRSLAGYSPWRCKELDTTEGPSTAHTWGIRLKVKLECKLPEGEERCLSSASV